MDNKISPVDAIALLLMGVYCGILFGESEYHNIYGLVFNAALVGILVMRLYPLVAGRLRRFKVQEPRSGR